MDLKIYGFLFGVLFFTSTVRSESDSGMVVSIVNDPGSIVTFPGIVDTGKIDKTFVYFYSDYKAIRSIASNPQKGDLFILDATLSRITRISNFNIWQNNTVGYFNVKTGVSNTFSRIAFDWTTENIYWTDQYYKWIGMKPAYASDATLFVIPLHQNLDKPEALALDPDGFLFWSDSGQNPKIERATLAGTDRQVLVDTNVLRVTDITVDVETRTLYWVDQYRHTIESCDYDGKHRRVITRQNFEKFTSVDFFKGKIYASSYIDKHLYIVDGTSGSILYYSTFSYYYPYAIHIYSKERYPTQTDACSSFKCQDICVNTPTGPSCLCRSNYNLAPDEETCIAADTYFERSIVFSNSSNICVLDIHIFTDKEQTYRCLNSLPSVGPLVAGREGIFYVDKETKGIKHISWGNQTMDTVADAGTVSSIVYTWVDDMIFWVDTATSTIKAKDLKLATTTSTELYKNIVLPSHLTMDQHSRTLYLITGYPSKKVISKGTANGAAMETVLKAGSLTDPKDLFYDITTQRLFLLDVGYLKSLAVDGSDLQTKLTVGSGISFIAYKEYAMWISGTSDLYYIDYQSENLPNTMSAQGSIKEIAIFDPTLMTETKGPCLAMNGGCEHICLPGNNGAVCKCKFGYKLQPDNRSCGSHPITTEFGIFADYLHEQIYQIPTSGRAVVALDIPMVDTPTYAVYHNLSQSVIWGEISSGQIKKADLFGNNVTTLYSLGNALPLSFAIDYTTGDIYFVAFETSLKSYVGVSKMKYSAQKTLYPGLEDPEYVAIYPSKGLIFWTDSGNIKRGIMDGSSSYEWQTKDVTWPNGITIDYEADLVYWADGYFDSIERCDLAGANRVRIAVDINAHLMSIDVIGSYLYYTAWQKRTITKMDKNTGSIVAWMSDMPELGRLDSIAFFPSEEQPINELCADRNGKCSTFCLPNENGRTCGCSDGISLMSDGRTCEGVTMCPLNIPNGQLSSTCLRYVEEECQYSCSSGFRKQPDVNFLTCDASGGWNQDIDRLCEEITCLQEFDRGNLSKSCDRRVRSQCSYTCLDSYTKDSNVPSVTCLSDGQWDKNIDTLCGDKIKVQQQEGNDVVVGVGAGVGVLLFVICGALVATALFIYRRRKAKRHPETPVLFQTEGATSAASGMSNPVGNDYCTLQKPWSTDEEVYHQISNDFRRSSGEYAKASDFEGFDHEKAEDERNMSVKSKRELPTPKTRNVLMDIGNPYLDLFSVEQFGSDAVEDSTNKESE